MKEGWGEIRIGVEAVGPHLDGVSSGFASRAFDYFQHLHVAARAEHDQRLGRLVSHPPHELHTRQTQSSRYMPVRTYRKAEVLSSQSTAAA